MSSSRPLSGSGSRARSVAFCGLAIALITVSAWISIPVGPIPVTLQIFAVAFVIMTLRPKEAVATILIYLALGAVGLPVFSSMRGGWGILAGPTGGFLWGYILGALAALCILAVVRDRKKTGAIMPEGVQATVHTSKAKLLGGDVCAGFVFLLISYACGWLQFVFVAGADPIAAFLTAIAPFIIIDILKIVAAAITSMAVKNALT